MVKTSIEDFCRRLAGDSEVGCGCAAALTALSGVSVLCKAARAMGRTDVLVRLAALKMNFAAYINEDAAIMKEVAPKLMAARPDEDADSWNDSLEKAMSVPAKVMKDILKVLRQARRLINDADIALLCDVRAGVVLLYGALESCALLAELNITLLEYASEKKDDMAWLLEERRNEAIDLYNNIMDMM